MVGSDLIHAVGEGRLRCEASGPPRGATCMGHANTDVLHFGFILVCTSLF